MLPTTSSALSGASQAAIKKLVEAMAPVCCIYDVDFRSMVEEQDLDEGEDMSGRVDFVLADYTYNIRRNRNDRNSDHDSFLLQDVMEMDKILGDFMKPRAHGHVLCSSLQSANWYKALVTQFTDGRKSVARDEDESGTEENDDEEVDQQPLFGGDDSPHYIRAAGNYQQSMAAKRATHTSVMEKEIHFWRAGES